MQLPCSFLPVDPQSAPRSPPPVLCHSARGWGGQKIILSFVFRCLRLLPRVITLISSFTVRAGTVQTSSPPPRVGGEKKVNAACVSAAGGEVLRSSFSSLAVRAPCSPHRRAVWLFLVFVALCRCPFSSARCARPTGLSVLRSQEFFFFGPRLAFFLRFFASMSSSPGRRWFPVSFVSFGNG